MSSPTRAKHPTAPPRSRNASLEPGMRRLELLMRVSKDYCTWKVTTADGEPDHVVVTWFERDLMLGKVGLFVVGQLLVLPLLILGTHQLLVGTPTASPLLLLGALAIYVVLTACMWTTTPQLGSIRLQPASDGRVRAHLDTRLGSTDGWLPKDVDCLETVSAAGNIARLGLTGRHLRKRAVPGSRGSVAGLWIDETWFPLAYASTDDAALETLKPLRTALGAGTH